MDYKKKYYEAQKWIESIYSELSHEQQMEAEAFFPELKESEDVDKKIREEIIATIHLYYGKPLEDEAKEMIAWLEKQAEVESDDDIEAEEKDIRKAFNKIWDEKQGEQKPANKVEPKFKVGDWVVVSTTKGDRAVQIASVEYFKDGSPSYTTTEGRWFGNGTKARLLTDKDTETITLPESKFIVKQKHAKWSEEELTDFEKSLKHVMEETLECGDIHNLKADAELLLNLIQKPSDEDMKEALRTEYEKGRADVLRCIDPDEMVADFCSQPLSKTRSLASIYRQGIIDIIKRINRNEETSITSTHSINDCGM